MGNYEEVGKAFEWLRNEDPDAYDLAVTYSQRPGNYWHPAQVPVFRFMLGLMEEEEESELKDRNEFLSQISQLKAGLANSELERDRLRAELKEEVAINRTLLRICERMQADASILEARAKGKGKDARFWKARADNLTDYLSVINTTIFFCTAFKEYDVLVVLVDSIAKVLNEFNEDSDSDPGGEE